MAFNPGRSVGRVSIRVVPDTKSFAKDLRKQLNDIYRNTRQKIRIDGAELDRERIKESIERQLAAMKDFHLDANVALTVDKAKLSKKKLRASIQEQFDQMSDIRVKITAEIGNPKEFNEQVRRLVRDASRKKAQIDLDAKSLGFTAHMKALTRPRTVPIYVKLSKASVSKVMATLTALSGARLTFKWIDDLSNMVRDLDKNLPSILAWTSGITSLVGGLFGATSGLVGLGQGLIAMLPGLLVVPGLILNAAGSVTALIVALKNSKKELAPLSDEMSTLGDIINNTFWDRARKPIIDLVTSLMPQLKLAFRDLSAGIGDFTKAMSDAFGKELANGRLASIFKGIADGWRILGSGADGFAGALVNLSQIAAHYTPRLASWLVRQAATFDNWLDRITTNGALDDMMQGAIDAVYDLWDATRGVAGVFTGIWKAADSAGSKGLHGFADMMLDWKRVVNSADFQTGLTAIFRGSHDAMDAFGDAVKAIGRLVADLDRPIELFIAAAGGFAGGLIESIAKALDNQHVSIGMTDLASGLTTALDRIKPSLQPIANTFGDFLGLLGDLASVTLPTAAGVLADLMPAIDSLVGAVRPVLKPMGDALASVSNILGPAIDDFVSTVSPSLADALKSIAGTLPDIAPAVADLVKALGPLAGGVAKSVSLAADVPGPVLTIKWLLDGNIDQLLNKVDAIRKSGGVLGWIMDGAFNFGDWIGRASGQITVAYMRLSAMVQTMVQNAPTWLVQKGQEVISGFFTGMQTGWSVAGAWVATIPTKIKMLMQNAPAWLVASGQRAIEGMKAGFAAGYAAVSSWLRSVPGKIQSAVGYTGSLLVSRGQSAILGLINGAKAVWSAITLWFRTRPQAIKSALGNLGSTLWNAGSSIISGFLNGIVSRFNAVKTFVGGIASWIAKNKGPESYDRQLLVANGQWIMDGFRKGLETGFMSVQSRVAMFADGVREQFGPQLGSDIAGGLAAGLKSANDTIKAARVSVSADGTTDGSGSIGGNRVSLNIYNPSTRDLQRDAWDAAQIAAGVLA